MEKHFLQNYDVHRKPEAIKAVKKKERLAGEQNLVRDYDERITAYIERLGKIFLDPGRKDKEKNEKTRRRNLEILKPTIYKNTLVKKEDFPESYFEHQKLEFKNMGMGDVKFSAQDKQQEIARVQEAQKKSLDVWIDHLSSDDSHYPDDIKYFAVQGILRTGSFDKDNYRFSKRTEATTAPFYQIDHEVLSMVMGALEAVHYHGDTTHYHRELLDLIEQNKDFGSMYAEAMRHLDKESGKDKALEITDGKWRVFKQGSDPQELVNAFAGKRAYLCLGNIGDASGYLSRGDVQVYFSNNRAGVPVWPRVAIAVEPDSGAYEMRGTYNANEDIDPEISQTDIIKNRLVTVPNGQSFAKKDADMKLVTKLYQKCFKVDKNTKEKTYLNPTLTKEELQFLYEINALIEGFGYESRDPRIAEIRDARDTNADLSIIFDCSPENIARAVSEISEHTKAYIGTLEPGIFDALPVTVEHIYTKFPKERVKFRHIELGTGITDGPTFQKAIEAQGMKIYRPGAEMLKNPDFKVVGERVNAELVEVSVRSLGFETATRYDNICERAKELGLAVCPAEVGPQLRLQYKDQPLDEYLIVAMNAINDSGGRPGVFSMGAEGDGLWLGAAYGRPGDEWAPEDRFVFLRPRKN